MSGASIRIEHDAAPLTAAFERLLHAAGDLTPAMREIAGEILFSTQRRFEREAGPGGAAWAPLRAATLRRNPRRAPPAKILRDTTRLYRSLVSDADAESAAVGTNVVYAALHQFGGDVKQAARQGSASFRLARLGAATDKDGKRVGSKLRFARASNRAKSLHHKSFAVPARTIRVPARPFLGFDAQDEATILDMLETHLGKTAEAAR